MATEPTDMTFLHAVKAWKFCYDLSDESVVGTSFSELLQIHSRYDVREEGDDARAVKLLHEKLHVPDKTNWQIRFAKIETEVNVKLPVGNIKDFRYVLKDFLTNRIVLEARSILSAMNVLMLSNKCRLTRLVLKFCRSLQTFVLFSQHITMRNVSLSNTEKRSWTNFNFITKTMQRCVILVRNGRIGVSINSSLILRPYGHRTRNPPT